MNLQLVLVVWTADRTLDFCLIYLKSSLYSLSWQIVTGSYCWPTKKDAYIIRYFTNNVVLTRILILQFVFHILQPGLSTTKLFRCSSKIFCYRYGSRLVGKFYGILPNILLQLWEWFGWKCSIHFNFIFSQTLWYTSKYFVRGMRMVWLDVFYSFQLHI